MTIDGLSAARVLQPASVAELSQALAGETGSVVPVGAGTQMHFGNPLRGLDCAVDLSRLNRITEYVPADLTIHVEAGLPLGELEAALARNHQFIPLDPWNGPRATIGGIAATNAQGPFRTTGTIRDWIIGMRVIEVNGKVSQTGGRVVKNVTGYDLAKLYTGSIGTLAIITGISLKVRARYGHTATAIARPATAGDAVRLLAELRTSPLQPVSCVWSGPGHEVWVRLGEHPRAVDWQLQHLPAADWEVLQGAEESDAWILLRERYERLGPITVKVLGLPSMMAEIIAEFSPSAWIAHVMNGIVLLAVSDIAEVRRMRTRYRAVVERAPRETREQLATFGLDDAEYDLMRKMKHAFDPEGRLNPGRHVDGERA